MNNDIINKVIIHIRRFFCDIEGQNMFRALDIANTFIEIGSNKTIPVSNMKLQKLLYYAQGWHMALIGKPLFNEDFKKWDFGPVCPEIYEEFKLHKGDYIYEPSCNGSILDKEEIIKFLDHIWKIYGKYTAIELSKLSHKESPWLTTCMYETISKEKIKNYFTKMLSDLKRA